MIIVVDTLRADHLGTYGDEVRGALASPRIDELAAAGIVFENALSHASWTC